MTERLHSDEIAFQHVIDKLVSKDLKPGDRVYEPGLCESLKMSRTPVRQALARLVEAGILTKPYRQKGYAVPILTTDDMAKLFPIREMVEGECAFYSAYHVRPQDLNTLRDLNKKILQYFDTDDRQNYAITDKEFHMYIFRLCNNPYLSRIATPLYWRSQLYSFYLGSFFKIEHSPGLVTDFKGSGKKRFEERERILDALDREDAEGSRKAMIDHIHQIYTELLL